MRARRAAWRAYSRLCDPLLDRLARSGDVRGALEELRRQAVVIPLVESVQYVGLSKRVRGAVNARDLVPTSLRQRGVGDWLARSSGARQTSLPSMRRSKRCAACRLPEACACGDVRASERRRFSTRWNGVREKAVGSSCARNAIHIQSQVPLVVARRLVEAVTTQLDAGAQNATSPDFRERQTALSRRLRRGGVFIDCSRGRLLVDYPVLLVVDDVQWADVESERVISRKPCVFWRMCASGAGGRGARWKRPSSANSALRSITLDRLSDAAIAEIVREHLPAATSEVVDAVVAHSAGIPMTAAVLAKETLVANVTSPDDVPASMRTVVARTVHQMSAPRREFLQLCSLIEDPIDYRVISKLYAGEDAAVEGFLRDLIPAFLTSGGASLFFAHASIAEAAFVRPCRSKFRIAGAF